MKKTATAEALKTAAKRDGKFYCAECGHRVRESAANHYCREPQPIPDEGETPADDTETGGENDKATGKDASPPTRSTTSKPPAVKPSDGEIDVDAALDAVYGEEEEKKAERTEKKETVKRDAKRKAKKSRKVLLTDVMPKGGKVVWHYVHRAEARFIDWLAGTKGSPDSVLKEISGEVGDTLDELANAAFPLHIDVKVAYGLMQVAVFGGHLAMHLDNLASRVGKWSARREEGRLKRAKVKKELKKLEAEE